MRIIQSYWACNRHDLLTNQSGWLSPEYNIMSWALSCLQLKKYYSDVVLYCDKETKRILVDELGLPYSEVYCELDKLNHYHSGLWAIPKIYCYSIQKKPFLHVDGDVFIWKAFGQELLNKPLIAQNLESATHHYNDIMIELENNLRFFPKEIIAERVANMPILAYNAGIFGGQDLEFFRVYSKKAFEFVDKNIQSLSNINVHNFNIFYEQYLFYCLAIKQNKEIGLLLDEVYGDNDYKGFGDFIEIPHNKQYLHILGTYKRNDAVCLQLANRLRLDYPEYYYRIIKLYKSNQIPLLHDYYHSNEIEISANESLRLKKEFVFDKISHKSKISKYSQSTEIGLSRLKLNKSQSHDLNIFHNKVAAIRSKKFTKISNTYLYGRDLNLTESFEYLFSDPTNIYQKSIIVFPNYEVVQSDFDWSKINHPIFYVENLSDQKKLTLVIPECNQLGYSLANIDLLDNEIFRVLKTKKTIGRLLNECKKMFDKTDFENSQKEFEQLIFGRIKKGIHNKVIRVFVE